MPRRNSSHLHAFAVARAVNYEGFMTRLDTIATRQRKLRTRDVLFACFVALAAIMTVTSLSSSWGFAQVHVVQR